MQWVENFVLGIIFVTFGYMAIFHKDMMWKLLSALHDLSDDDRNSRWNSGMNCLGVFVFFCGVSLLLIALLTY